MLMSLSYMESECGYYASGKKSDGITRCAPVSISVWVQTGAYLLIAISEILASITSLEYAFSKAPYNMRSLIAAFSLLMTAVAAAIGEAFVSLSADPLLVWNYSVMAVLSFIGGTCFWFQYRDLDREEDHLNMLPTGRLRENANGDRHLLEANSGLQSSKS
jgi:POT family proton-dependent oligopeptide transporter